MKALIVLLFVSFTVFAQDDIARELNRHSDVSGTIARLDAFSKDYLGLPYGDGGPLGEGPAGRYDQDPLWRFDTYDCTTFVETMISLAHAHSPQDFQDHMRDIRYANGVIDYVQRNHFPSRDWIPNNIANGYLTDLTPQLVAPEQIKLASALIDLPNHYRMKQMEELRVFDLPRAELPNRLQEWRAEGEHLTAEVANLNYIAIDWLVNHPEVL